jgi:tetratricopeptide (TPR) repeat protein
MTKGFHFYDEGALLERLSNGLKKHSQEVVFLVGAALSAPVGPAKHGVPGVDGVIDFIRSEFDGDLAQLTALDDALRCAGMNRYQAAFQFLQGRRGQQAANRIVRKAVEAARLPGSRIGETHYESISELDDACRVMESDTEGWVLAPGTLTLGKLVTGYPARFGKTVLTTNFDPLIEVAIHRAGGNFYRTTLHSDGNLSQTVAKGCHVIHFHGYWYGSDTLHTSRQLTQHRPRLKDSLSHLLLNKLVVVCGYGGWDDAFTEALIDVVRDEAAYPEIIWTFYPQKPDLDRSLSRRLDPGIARGRVSLYAGIDCNHIFPELYNAWLRLEAESTGPASLQSNPVRVHNTLYETLRERVAQPTVVEGDDQDRPPVVDICVGREKELGELRASKARVAFLTGLGGQGKSTLAAQYFTESQANCTFSFYVWRDCKEESERFENQLASVIERLSHGRISGEDLAKQSVGTMVEILFKVIEDVPVLFVFDNVDHYVDLESEKMVGSPDTFVSAMLGSGSKSRVIFTCRPIVTYNSPFALSLRLEGIDLEAAFQLFSERNASAKRDEINDAHLLTEGHAFWLDLLALQTAKRTPSVNLTDLVNEIRSGGGPLPDKTLNSVWATLREREQTVLRAMAETVKPETEEELGEYLSQEMNYNKLVKALRALRALNLVVVKREADAPDVLELHPVVRQFVRSNFTPYERFSYINAIINVYQRHIGKYRSQLSGRPPLSLLQYWTQDAELAIAAGKMEDAFSALGEVAISFTSSAYPREFTRTVRRLLKAVDWIADYSKFKAFDHVFSQYVDLLGYLGEYEEVDGLLDGYEKTVPDKDARYINYCRLRCSSFWVRGEFATAVRWGKVGQNLKDSGVDTRYEVAHALALAERDAGHPDLALPVFLRGRRLEEVVDPEELDEEQIGAYYGNIGRCLQFMGQIDSALICYQKSALLLEKHSRSEVFVNEGFVRAWIGEVLLARQQFMLAAVFLRAAYSKWAQASPPRASRIHELLAQIEDRIPGGTQLNKLNVERICRDWILGRRLDAQFR